MGFESLNQVLTVLEMPRIDDPGVAKVRAALGNVPAPKDFWQKAFDYDEGHLNRLIKLRPGESADGMDLIDYALDFQYEEVQLDLFRFAFPFCLDAWRRDLHGHTNDYGGFVENFYPALAKTSVFTKVLETRETEAVAAFVRAEILRVSAREPTLEPYVYYPPYSPLYYRWLEAFSTYGVIFPDMERLWSPWWSAECAGHAMSVVYYASCLVYPWDDNPAFASVAPRWGAPELWEFGGHLYDGCWQKPNLDFLGRTLSWESLCLALERALPRLGEPEFAIAARVLDDCPAHEREVAGRIAEMLDKLASDRD